jgi:hypothetical protein
MTDTNKDAGRPLYSKWVDQQGIHSNRLPAWSELSDAERVGWNVKAAPASSAPIYDHRAKSTACDGTGPKNYPLGPAAAGEVPATTASAERCNCGTHTKQECDLAGACGQNPQAPQAVTPSPGARALFKAYCDYAIDGADIIDRDWLFHFCTNWQAIQQAAPKASTLLYLVNRFLAWPLPGSLRANLPNIEQPIGTHLMNADEAKAMFEYVLASPVTTTASASGDYDCYNCGGKESAHNEGCPAIRATAPSREAAPQAPESSLRNWLNVIHDNELSMGDRLQRLSSGINSILSGDAADKYPQHVIREPGNEAFVLFKLCDQLDSMKRTMFLMPGTGQHYSYLLLEDVSAYVEEARAAHPGEAPAGGKGGAA